MGLRDQLHSGLVIPAHPLALNSQRHLDERRQRALSRYYLDAGAGGLAIGVHTTQFAIRAAGIYEPVLASAAASVASWAQRPVVMIAGVCGSTEEAVREARIAVAYGYHGALLGHWSVWVKRAVELWRRCDQAVHAGKIDADLLALAARVTDCNGAFFDAANDFRGAIAGCHEVLRRQGLLAGIWCLDPVETLSSGQSEEIDR